MAQVTVDRKKAQVTLIGAAKQMGNAKMLLELHMKHQGDMARLHSARGLLEDKLQSERTKRDTGVTIEFPVDKELLGLVIGPKGKTIEDAKRASGVHFVEVNPNPPRVRVTGPTAESCEAAREVLEFVSVRPPLD